MAFTDNLFLIGMPGAGKSTLGKALARRLDRRFVDADRFLVERTGADIPTIFAMEGEEGFRARETEAIRALCGGKNLVLATGGGAVLRAENRRLLRENGCVVYFHLLPEKIFPRIAQDKNRPLLQNADPQATLQALYRERDPLYRAVAHKIVEVGDNGVHYLVNRLLRELSADGGAPR